MIASMQPVAFPTFFIGMLLHEKYRDEGIGNQTLPLSDSGSEGSEGTYPILMYVDSRPRPDVIFASLRMANFNLIAHFAGPLSHFFTN